jgi:hypothetical protein
MNAAPSRGIGDALAAEAHDRPCSRHHRAPLDLDMLTRAARELADLLLRRTEAVPIEQGVIAVLESIAGSSPIDADVSVAPVGQVTDEERVLLGAPILADVHRWHGLLRCAPDIPVAHVSALMVAHRVPDAARTGLGISPRGEVQPDGHSRPVLGHVLYGLGVTREQLVAAATPYQINEADSEIAVLSVARLWTPSGWPLALVTERVHATYLAACPPPWPLANASGGHLTT